MPSSNRWRTGDIAPITRNLDTGEWDWAVPNIVTGLIDAVKLPGEVMRGEVDPMSEVGFERTMNLAGLGVTPFRAPARGMTLTNRPAVTGPSTKHKGVLSELSSRIDPGDVPHNEEYSRVAVPRTREPYYFPEEGFFMGPFATPENMPGVSLASRPQSVHQMAHGTDVSTIYDQLRTSSGIDEALHLSNDPDLVRTYTHIDDMAPFMHIRPEDIDELLSDATTPAPRSYPTLVNPGSNPADIGDLVGLYPWREYGVPENIMDDPFYRELVRDNEINPMYREAAESVSGGEKFRDFMKRKGYTSMWYGHEPTFPELLPHESIAITNPGQIMSQISPEGVLASKWNKVEPMQQSSMSWERNLDTAMGTVGLMYDQNKALEILRRMGFDEDQVKRAEEYYW